MSTQFSFFDFPAGEPVLYHPRTGVQTSDDPTTNTTQIDLTPIGPTMHYSAYTGTVSDYPYFSSYPHHANTNGGDEDEENKWDWFVMPTEGVLASIVDPNNAGYDYDEEVEMIEVEMGEAAILVDLMAVEDEADANGDEDEEMGGMEEVEGEFILAGEGDFWM